MGKVTTGATMSLDGFIADASHGSFDYLFKWYGAGDVEVPAGHPDTTFKVSAASAEHLRRLNERLGALVAGRRRYDMTSAWGGHHPLDLTTVVVTHQRPSARPEDDENFVFATTGIADAVARARGDRQRQGRRHQRGRDRLPVLRRAADGRGARSTSSTREGSGRRATADRGAAGPAVLGCHQVSAIGGLVKRP